MQSITPNLRKLTNNLHSLSRSFLTNHRYFEGETIFIKEDYPKDKIDFYLKDAFQILVKI